MNEPLDRNKTELTHKLTALAVGHLTVIGCKPIETEVPVASGWIADVAGFTYPTMTEMKMGKILKRVILMNPLCGSDYRSAEFITTRHLFPLTAICEIKISIADFKKDYERKFKHTVANLNYLVIPKSIQDTIEPIINEGHSWKRDWSLIICSDNGEKILKCEIPYICGVGVGETIDIIANIAIRRCHRTQYSFNRAMLKAYRADKWGGLNQG